jgi:hypothetical protein
MWYNKDESVLQYCNGTDWIDMGPREAGGTGTCASPAGVPGEVDYNEDESVLQYCNGANWIAMGPKAPQAPSTPTSLTVFATSGTYTGDLVTEATTFTGSAPANAIAGADAICQKHAGDAGLLGTYKAWIATTNVATVPATRFTDINGTVLDFKLVNGTTVANGWTDLTDNSLDNAINRTELDTAASSFAWSNVTPDGTGVQGGTASNDTCNEWTDSGAGSSGRYGQTSKADIFWTFGPSGGCNNTQALYCFQQTGGAASGCTNPDGPAGEVVYNDDLNIMQYCNGAQWIGIR